MASLPFDGSLNGMKINHATFTDALQIALSIDGPGNWKEKLEALKNSNLLTNEEFIVKLKQLDDRVYNQTILNSSEYQNLTTLLENNFLTKEEFDKKISALKEQFSHVNSPVQYKQQKQRYIINGFAYFYEEIESFFADGNYLFSKNSDIEVENEGIKKVTDIPSLSKILKYFPPN